jgi:hypothetical protein
MNISWSNEEPLLVFKLLDSSLIIERTTATGGVTEAQETKKLEHQGMKTAEILEK